MRKGSDFNRLSKYAGNYRILVILSVALAVMSAAAAVSPFVFLHRIIFQLLGNSEQGLPEADAAVYGMITCWLVFTFILSRAVSLICACSAGVHASAEIRRQLNAHIGRLPVMFTEEFGIERLKKIIMGSAEVTEGYLSKTLPDFVFAVTMPFMLAAGMLIFDLSFGLICLIPLAAGVITALLTAKQPASENASKHRRLFTALTISAGSFFAFIILTALVLSQETGITADRSVELAADIVFYGVYTPMIYTALMKLADASGAYGAVRAAADSIESILNIEPPPEPDEEKLPEDFSILFTHVTYHNPELNRDIINNISVRIIDRDTVAFVGTEASGREAIPDLISGKVKAAQGSVMIGNVDVTDISRQVLSNNITIISGNVKLMNASVADNVRMARLNADRYEIIDALHAAGCDDFVQRLSNGIDTVINTGHIFLMQPDKLKLELARAYLKNAPIVILDNVVKGLKPEDEAAVTKVLDEFCAGRTVIMLPYKLPSARSANRIYVMSDGKMLEYGRHDILMRMNSAYCKLWADYHEQYDFMNDRNRWRID